MAHKPARARRHGARGRGRGKPNPGRFTPRSDFKTSRLQEVEDFSNDDSVESEQNVDQDEVGTQDGKSSSSADEGVPDTQSYASLLRVLKASQDQNESPSKRRKLIKKVAEEAIATNGRDGLLSRPTAGPNEIDANLEEQQEEEESTEPEDIDSDDELMLLQDPFEQHYSKMNEQDMATAIAESKEKKPKITTVKSGQDVKKTSFFFEAYTAPALKTNGIRDLHLKQRLIEQGSNVLSSFGMEEKDLASEMFAYRDILYGLRSSRNVSEIRDSVCLHALNHIFKTRDRVLKNNAKLSHDGGGDADLRDQGFTRPKVLFLLPTKQACARFVESIAKLSEPDQQENKSRFLDTFSQQDQEPWDNKPADFRELFGGNNEEDFRVGLKFTRRTIKFFSGFYTSDMILASPLGLMRALTTESKNSKGEKRAADSDFLSSIEIVILDHANAIEMQNWQHVEYVFAQLNLLPKESHGCDFSRARTWYLDGNAKYLRQTIIVSSYLTPSINSLMTSQLHNIAGRVKYARTYLGEILSLPASLPMTITQTFLRFFSPSPMTESDARFNYFTSSLLPTLLRHRGSSAKGTLIFIPTYFDFVRIRNHFSTSTATTALSFGTLSEYTSIRDAARARSHFASGRHSVLLYTERAHHYFRYRIRGVQRVVFYGLPENPSFWSELIALLGLETAAEKDDRARENIASNRQGKGLVRAMFSKWDAMKLERVVGSERVGRLVSEREGDVFDFV